MVLPILAAIGKGLAVAAKAVAAGAAKAGAAVGKGAATVAKGAAQGVAHGAKAAGQGLANGARAVGQGVVNGAQAVGHGIQSGASTVGQNVSSVAHNVGQGISNGVHNVGDKLTSFQNGFLGRTGGNNLASGMANNSLPFGANNLTFNTSQGVQGIGQNTGNVAHSLGGQQMFNTQAGISNPATNQSSFMQKLNNARQWYNDRPEWQKRLLSNAMQSGGGGDQQQYIYEPPMSAVDFTVQPITARYY